MGSPRSGFRFEARFVRASPLYPWRIVKKKFHPGSGIRIVHVALAKPPIIRLPVFFLLSPSSLDFLCLHGDH
jgi:hypothetical protein